MRIMAFDPGSKRLGFALYDSKRGPLDHGTVSMDDGMPTIPRLLVVRRSIQELLPDGVDIDIVVVEQMFSMRRHGDFELHVISFLVQWRAYVLDVVCVQVPLSTWKKAVVGRGNAEKKEVQEAMHARFGGTFAEDEADALAIACYAAEKYGS